MSLLRNAKDERYYGKTATLASSIALRTSNNWRERHGLQFFVDCKPHPRQSHAHSRAYSDPQSQLRKLLEPLDPVSGKGRSSELHFRTLPSTMLSLH